MTNAKSTKRALISSALAIVLCLAMLIGTTFAWFTDTASTGVNKIQAGNLHVAIQDEAGNSIETLEWHAADNRAQDEILWEPGATYTLTPFKIANTGNLALKYKLVVTGLEGDAKLLDVIKFSYTINGETLDLSAEGLLLPEQTTDMITVSATMDKAAGNEYMNEVLTGVTITVYATQATVENDSISDQYDKDATYPVANADELKGALTSGGIVNVATDVPTNNLEDTADARMIITAPTTLNLDKKIISPDNMGDNNNNFAALYVDADTTINAGENGGIDTGINGGYGINVRKGATLTINGGYYYGGGTAVQVQKGTLIINGGTFACQPFDGSYGYNFLINCVDAAYNDETAKVTIKGGTFVNWDPSDSAGDIKDGVHANFVADGYKVVHETQANGDIWYTVIPA